MLSTAEDEAGNVYKANTGPARGGLPDLSSSASQLEARFKHAADFGVTDSRGAAGLHAFSKAVHSKSPVTQNGSATHIATTGEYLDDNCSEAARLGR
jgi:hypothetical protein